MTDRNNPCIMIASNKSSRGATVSSNQLQQATRQAEERILGAVDANPEGAYLPPFLDVMVGTKSFHLSTKAFLVGIGVIEIEGNPNHYRRMTEEDWQEFWGED